MVWSGLDKETPAITPVGPTHQWPTHWPPVAFLHTPHGDGTFMTTTARIYVQTYAIYRLLSEITDDHLHVLLNYYYNVYLSYSSHYSLSHYYSLARTGNKHTLRTW